MPMPMLLLLIDNPTRLARKKMMEVMRWWFWILEGFLSDFVTAHFFRQLLPEPPDSNAHTAGLQLCTYVFIDCALFGIVGTILNWWRCIIIQVKGDLSSATSPQRRRHIERDATFNKQKWCKHKILLLLLLLSWYLWIMKLGLINKSTLLLTYASGCE